MFAKQKKKKRAENNYLNMWRDVRMQMHVLVYTQHTSRHASMCMHVCMCALPTAASLAPDPSYAAARADCS